MKRTILITGAAGYVGAMLVERFAKREDIGRIIGVDKEPLPELLAKEPKLLYIEANTSDGTWQERARAERPDIVIHTAWQIREVYGDHALTWKWNIDGSDAVFDFALGEPSVERLIHFSTVASYGAYPDNSTGHRYAEDEPFRKMDYLYAEEKRIAEEHLEEKYAKSDKRVNVAVVRPAAITGPRGRFMRIRFGLQAALSGQLKDSFAYRLVSGMVSFVPVTPKWLRQFIHEDDVVGIVERLAFGEPVKGYEVFNICPPGPVVLGPDMAKAVGKRLLPVYPWMVRFPFFVFWHLSRGKIPTGKGAWKSYSYPIAVDGSKVTRELGYAYAYPSFDAFYYTNGAYESFVPESARRHK
ncbi:MAG: NAD-dependent epimerase/dehydratase family protein [bacterium]